MVRHHKSGSHAQPSALINRLNKEDKAAPERLTQTALQQNSAKKDFRTLADFFGSRGYLHLVPQVVREGAAQKSYKSRLTTIQKILKVAVPQFESLELIRDDNRRPHLLAKFDHWRATAAKQNETPFPTEPTVSSVSSGPCRISPDLSSYKKRNSLSIPASSPVSPCSSIKPNRLATIAKSSFPPTVITCSRMPPSYLGRALFASTSLLFPPVPCPWKKAPASPRKIQWAIDRPFWGTATSAGD